MVQLMSESFVSAAQERTRDADLCANLSSFNAPLIPVGLAFELVLCTLTYIRDLQAVLLTCRAWYTSKAVKAGIARRSTAAATVYAAMRCALSKLHGIERAADLHVRTFTYPEGNCFQPPHPDFLPAELCRIRYAAAVASLYATQQKSQVDFHRRYCGGTRFYWTKRFLQDLSRGMDSGTLAFLAGTDAGRAGGETVVAGLWKLLPCSIMLVTLR